jgi:hypothetical protein
MSGPYVTAVLLGEMSLGPGPVYGGGATIKECAVATPPAEQEETLKLNELYHHATSDYLSHCAKPLELEVMTQLGVSVESQMIKASYMKRLMETETPTNLRSKLVIKRCYVNSGSTTTDIVAKRSVWRGVLSKYPLLMLMKETIPKDKLRELVRAEGAPEWMTPEVAAWGAEAVGYRLVGLIPYSDAAQYSKRMTEGVLYTTYAVYM